jgi:hypothetical protein
VEVRGAVFNRDLQQIVDMHDFASIRFSARAPARSRPGGITGSIPRRR